MAGIRTSARKLANMLGVRNDGSAGNRYPPDYDAETIALFETVKPYTMTSIERVAALQNATKYVARHKIPGDIVECGVWKGGSMMTVAKTLIECGSTDRSLFLFDTFEGMPPPSNADKDLGGNDAAQIMKQSQNNRANDPVWAVGPLEDVKQAMQLTGYDPFKIVYVKGKVEDTIPQRAPKQIALLRLDTDWYESTYHELVHLYPRLSVGGVLVIDDYGHWQGARRAVDQYLEENRLKLLLNRIDYTGRIAVKTE
jgi:O-methyltransferase